MNYIKELNAFYQKIMFDPLSGPAVALWNTLMHVNNRCGWRKQFSAAAGMLESIAGIKGGSFQRARKELQKRGFIIVTKRGGNQAALYQMISQIQVYDEDGSLASDVTDEPGHQGKDRLTGETDGADTKTVSRSGSQAGAPVQDDRMAWENEEHAISVNAVKGEQQVIDYDRKKVQQQEIAGYRVGVRGKPNVIDEQTNTRGAMFTDDWVEHIADGKPVHNAAPLFKHRQIQNDTKPNITTTDAFCFYQANFGLASPYMQEDMLYWIQDMEEELVLHAMKLALEQNKAAWSYVKGILKTWHRKGIVDVQQAVANDVAFRNQRGEGRIRGQRMEQRMSSEVVPEWFHEHKQQKHRRRAVAEPEIIAEDDPELEALLAEFVGK